MLTEIIYNCNPEYLGDMSPTYFANAFADVVHMRPIWGNLMVTVTFYADKSEVTAFTSDDFDCDVSHEDEFRNEFDRLANSVML